MWNVLGLIVGLISIIVSLFIYRASQIGVRPVYQFTSQQLIAKSENRLTDDIEIMFQGISIPTLTVTNVLFWNAGKKTLEAKSVVEEDPLRIEVKDGEVLRAQVLAVSRQINKFTVVVDKEKVDTIFLGFDFLDPKDGAKIELLHTSNEITPVIKGTIRRVPRGIKCLGRIISSDETFFLPVTAAIFYKIFSFFPMLSGLTIILLLLYPTQESTSEVILAKWLIILFGGFLILLSAFIFFFLPLKLKDKIGFLIYKDN